MSVLVSTTNSRDLRAELQMVQPLWAPSRWCSKISICAFSCTARPLPTHGCAQTNV